MLQLRMDLVRLYEARRKLFSERWSYGERPYAAAAANLNTRIRGLETMICEYFSGDICGLFENRDDIEY